MGVFDALQASSTLRAVGRVGAEAYVACQANPTSETAVSATN